MSPRRKKAGPPAAELRVVLDAPGLTPETIEIDELGLLLERTAAAIRAIEDETKAPSSLPHLQLVDKGSAAAVLVADFPEWNAVTAAFVRAAGNGCIEFGASVRRAFTRMIEGATSRKRKLMVEVQGHASIKPGRIAVQQPLPPVGISWGTELYGRVMGTRINSRPASTGTVELEVDGRRIELAAPREVVAAAADRFEKTVRCTAYALRVGMEDSDWQAERIEPWDETDDPVGLFRSIRDEMERRGLTRDLDDILRDLNED